MHDVIHDHNDANAAIILTHTAQAMSKSSKLLIADWVIRDRNAQKQACSTDWQMMMVTSGGMERSMIDGRFLMSAWASDTMTTQIKPYLRRF